MSTVLAADRIAVLDGGVIRAKGTHLDLLERSGVYRRLYERQWKDTTAVANGRGGSSPGGSDAGVSIPGPQVRRPGPSGQDAVSSSSVTTPPGGSGSGLLSSTQGTGTDGMTGAIPFSSQA